MNNGEKETTGLMDEYLEEVGEQIAYKPLRPTVLWELEAHILDRMEELEEDGLTREEAEQKAVAAMGDAITTGAQINAVRHIRNNPLLTSLTAFLVLSSFGIAVFMYLSPSLRSDGYFYYIPGINILLFIVNKGYPLLLKYWKRLLFTLSAMYFMDVLLTIALYLIPAFWYYLPYMLVRRLEYYLLLLLAPILTIALYRIRRMGVKAILAAFLANAACVVYVHSINPAMGFAASIVCLVSLTAATCYMIRKNLFLKKKIRLYATAAISFLSISGFCLFQSWQDNRLITFINPEAAAHSMWDDAYNGVLIQELLSRTPVTKGISLSADEMVSYGSGSWYFKDEKTPPEESLPYRINYDKTNVTLTDILPQHYHNNYLIAAAILFYGWIAGILILAVIALFYAVLFACIFRIRGKLAGCLSFCCGVCLLAQSILYILGNFGYQYGAFTTLPILSEGFVSIIVNMMLLGFILSAYRYDNVIEEQDSCPVPLKP